MTLIIALLIAGILLVAAEVFLPSGVIITLGGACLVGGTVLAFMQYGAFGGLLAGALSVIASIFVVVLELRLLPHTSLGRRMFNQQASSGRAVETGADTAAELIGKTGRAATAFAPTGLAEIEGRQYEASCLDGFLHAGEPLVVAGRDSYKLLVKKAPVLAG
jgi:membrane-bound ClpP family serine protease